MKIAIEQKWYRKFKRAQSLFTVAAFLVTNHLSLPTALASLAHSSIQVSADAQVPNNILQLEVPPAIGKIEEVFQAKGQEHASRPSPPAPVVILIQDAHAIPEAQRNIQKLIEHFQREYGVGLVALEGAASELDPQMFKSFPDKEKLKKTFEAYFENAELTGTTAAAIFSESPAIYQGIEDWDLYEEGLGLFLKAMTKELMLLEKLQASSRRLQKEKEKVYSPELLEIDRTIEAFHNNEADLIQVLKTLAKKRERVSKKGTGSEVLPASPVGGPVPFSVQTLLKEIEKEGKDESSLEREVRGIAGEVKKYLDQESPQTTDDRPQIKDNPWTVDRGLWTEFNAKYQEFPQKVSDTFSDTAAFNQKYQEFQTSRISPEAFALFLKELAEKGTGREALPVPFSARLTRLMSNYKRLRDIEGTQFFRDFEAYVKSVKEALFRDGEERRLDAESRRLELFEKLAKLELSWEEWEEIRESLFVKREADFGPHLAFYTNAEKRDNAFVNNLSKLMTANASRDTLHASLLIAGGFHTEGLARQFKEKGISYVIVRPEIKSIPEQNPYRQQMQGNVSWKDYFQIENGSEAVPGGGKVNLYEAFVRGARDQLLREALSVKSETKENMESTTDASRDTLHTSRLLKSWRDQIIRDLAKNEQLAKSHEYTQFLDEITQDSSRKILDSNPDWVSKINRFIAGLRRLENRKQLTEPNVLRLLQPAMYGVPEINGQLAPGSNLSATMRAEVRSGEPEYRAGIESAENLKQLWSIENEIVRNHSIKTLDLKEKLLDEIEKKRQWLARSELRLESSDSSTSLGTGRSELRNSEGQEGWKLTAQETAEEIAKSAALGILRFPSGLEEALSHYRSSPESFIKSLKINLKESTSIFSIIDAVPVGGGMFQSSFNSLDASGIDMIALIKQEIRLLLDQELKDSAKTEADAKVQALKGKKHPELSATSVDAYGALYRGIRQSIENLTEITESDLERARSFLTPQGALKSFEERRANGAFGISEVYFLPASSTRDRMAAFQRALKERFKDKVYLVDEDKLHLTMQGLRELATHAGKDAINPGEEPFAGVIHRGNQIQTPAVQMQVGKVNWNPSIGIFWEVQPYLEDSSNDPIMKRREAWGLSQPRPPHITAAYFTQPFSAKALEELKSFIAQYQSDDHFGDINVSEAQIIAYEDLSFNAGYRVLTRSFFHSASRSEVRNETDPDFDSDFEGDLSESLSERVAEHLRSKITELREAEKEGRFADYPLIDQAEYWEGELNLLAGMGNDVLRILENARANAEDKELFLDGTDNDIAYLQWLLAGFDRISHRSEVREKNKWVEEFIRTVQDEYLTAALTDKRLKNLNYARLLAAVSYQGQSRWWRFRASFSGWSEGRLIKETLRRIWRESQDSHHWEITGELKAAIVKYQETKLSKNGAQSPGWIPLVLKEIENLDTWMTNQVVSSDVEEIVRENQSSVQTATVVRAAVGKAFQSAESFDAYIDERFATLLHGNESYVGKLLQKWHKAKDPKEKNRIEKQEIYPFLARINSQGLGITPEEVEVASDVNLLFPSEYSRDLQKPTARYNLDGKVAHQFLFWQDARDFQSRDPRKKGMYFVDFTEFARNLKHPVKTNEKINPNLAVPFGPRQLIALRMRIEEDAQWLGSDPKEALARIPIILSVNKGNVDAIIEDLTDEQHNFYGFSRDNVYFTVADEFHGRTIRTGFWGWLLGLLERFLGIPHLRLIKAKESPLWSAGHGYKTAQLAQPGMAFRINADNETNALVDSSGKPISVLDHLEARKTEVMLTHHDIDLTQITRDVLDLSRLTKIKELIGQSEDGVKAAVVTEMVANSHRQPGGYRVLVKTRKTMLDAGTSLLNFVYFILETVINAADEWKNFFQSQANLLYNAFRNGYAISPLKKSIMKYGIPVWIIFRDGYLYPLVLTGDLTLNEYLRTGNKSYMKQKNVKSAARLGDSGKDKQSGEEIHDVKGIGNLTEATDFMALQDQDPRFLRLAREFGSVKPIPGSRDYVGELIQGLDSPNSKVQRQSLQDFKQNLGRMGTSANESIRYLSDLFRFERPVDVSVLQEAAAVLGEIGQDPVNAENLISWLLKALTVEMPAFDPSASDQDAAHLQSYLDRIKILHRMAAEVVRRIGRSGFIALERALLSASRNSDVTHLRVIMELMVALDSETSSKRQLTELDKATFETLVKIPARGIGLSALARNTLAKIFSPYDLKDWLFHNDVLKPEERKLVGEILLDLGIEHVFLASRDSRNFLLEWIKKGDSGMRFLIQEVIKKMDESNMRNLSDNFIHDQFQSPMPLQQDAAERMLAVLGMMGVFTESPEFRNQIVNFLVHLLSVSPATRVAAKNKLLRDVRKMAAEALSWIQSSRSPKVALDESIQATLEKEFNPFLNFGKDYTEFEQMHGKMTSLLASKELMPLTALIQYHEGLSPKLTEYFHYLFSQYSLDGRSKATDKTQEIIQKLDFIIIPYAVRALQNENQPLSLREGAGVILDSLQMPDFVLPHMKAPSLREFDTLTVVSVSRSSIVFRGEKNNPKLTYYIKFPVGALRDRETKVTEELYRKAALRPYLPDAFAVREVEYQDSDLLSPLRLKILDKAKEDTGLKGVNLEELANFKEGQTYFLFSEAGNQNLEAWIDASMDRLQKHLDPDELNRVLKDLKQAVRLTAMLHGLGISHGDLGKSLLVHADKEGIRSMKFIDFALSIVMPKFDYLPEEYKLGGGFKGFGYLGNFFDDTPISMIASLMANATVQKGEPPWLIRKKLDSVTLLDHVARIAARLPQEHDMYVRFQDLAKDNMTRLADFYFSLDKRDPNALQFVTASDIEAFLNREIEALAQHQDQPSRSELRVAISHDAREDIIAKLKEVLGEDQYDFYLSGFSSIDIMRKGISKASAMEDYFKHNQLAEAIYFGDEFYEVANKKGNDIALLEASANFARDGKKLFLFSTDPDPESRTQEAKEQTIWIGPGSGGTKEILRLILEGIEAGKQEVLIQGKGPDKDKSMAIRLDELVLKGALVFDADGTILEGKEENFSNQPEIRKLFTGLLQNRVRSAIMTGNSKALQKERMADALKSAPEIQEPGLMAGFAMYVNGGATRILYDISGQEHVQHLSEEIPDSDIQKIVALLARESKHQYGLNTEEIGAWKAFFKFDGQYGERPDFPGFKFAPWWNQERFTPLVIEAETIKNADPSSPLLLTEPYVEVRDNVQVSLKLFPRGLTPEGDKPQPPRSEARLPGRQHGSKPGTRGSARAEVRVEKGTLELARQIHEIPSKEPLGEELKKKFIEALRKDIAARNYLKIPSNISPKTIDKYIHQEEKIRSLASSLMKFVREQESENYDKKILHEFDKLKADFLFVMSNDPFSLKSLDPDVQHSALEDARNILAVYKNDLPRVISLIEQELQSRQILPFGRRALAYFLYVLTEGGEKPEKYLPLTTSEPLRTLLQPEQKELFKDFITNYMYHAYHLTSLESMANIYAHPRFKQLKEHYFNKVGNAWSLASTTSHFLEILGYNPNARNIEKALEEVIRIVKEEILPHVLLSSDFENIFIIHHDAQEEFQTSLFAWLAIIDLLGGSALKTKTRIFSLTPFRDLERDELYSEASLKGQKEKVKQELLDAIATSRGKTGIVVLAHGNEDGFTLSHSENQDTVVTASEIAAALISRISATGESSYENVHMILESCKSASCGRNVFFELFHQFLADPVRVHQVLGQLEQRYGPHPGLPIFPFLLNATTFDQLGFAGSLETSLVKSLLKSGFKNQLLMPFHLSRIYNDFSFGIQEPGFLHSLEPPKVDEIRKKMGPPNFITRTTAQPGHSLSVKLLLIGAGAVVEELNNFPTNDQPVRSEVRNADKEPINKKELLEFITHRDPDDPPSSNLGRLGKIGKKLEKKLSPLLGRYREFGYPSRDEMWAEVPSILFMKKEKLEQSLNGSGDVGPYIYTVTERAFIDVRRARTGFDHKHNGDVLLDHLASGTPDPGGSVILKEEIRHYHEMLDQLPAQEKQLAEAYITSVPYEQIALQLNIKADQVRMKIFHLKARLKEMLDEYENREKDQKRGGEILKELQDRGFEEKQRKLIYHYLHGLRQEEIANRLKLSKVTLGRHLAQVWDRLPPELKKDIEELHARKKMARGRSELRIELPKEFFDAVNGEYPWETQVNSKLKNLGFVYYLALVYFEKLQPGRRLMGLIPGMPEKEVVEQTLIRMVEAHEELRSESALPKDQKLIDEIWHYEMQKGKVTENKEEEAAILRVILDERQSARDSTKRRILTRDKDGRYLADYIRQVVSSRSEVRLPGRQHGSKPGTRGPARAELRVEPEQAVQLSGRVPGDPFRDPEFVAALFSPSHAAVGSYLKTLRIFGHYSLKLAAVKYFVTRHPTAEADLIQLAIARVLKKKTREYSSSPVKRGLIRIMDPNEFPEEYSGFRRIYHSYRHRAQSQKASILTPKSLLDAMFGILALRNDFGSIELFLTGYLENIESEIQKEIGWRRVFEDQGRNGNSVYEKELAKVTEPVRAFIPSGEIDRRIIRFNRWSNRPRTILKPSRQYAQLGDSVLDLAILRVLWSKHEKKRDFRAFLEEIKLPKRNRVRANQNLARVMTKIVPADSALKTIAASDTIDIYLATLFEALLADIYLKNEEGRGAQGIGVEEATRFVIKTMTTRRSEIRQESRTLAVQSSQELARSEVRVAQGSAARLRDIRKGIDYDTSLGEDAPKWIQEFLDGQGDEKDARFLFKSSNVKYVKVEVLKQPADFLGRFWKWIYSLFLRIRAFLLAEKLDKVKRAEIIGDTLHLYVDLSRGRSRETLLSDLDENVMPAMFKSLALAKPTQKEIENHLNPPPPIPQGPQKIKPPELVQWEVHHPDVQKDLQSLREALQAIMSVVAMPVDSAADQDQGMDMLSYLFSRPVVKNFDLQQLYEGAKHFFEKYHDQYFPTEVKPLAKLSSADNTTVAQFLLDLNYLIFLPNGEYIGFGRNNQMTRWIIDENTWEEKPYLGRSIWLSQGRLAGDRDNNRVQYPAFTDYRYIFSDPEFLQADGRMRYLDLIAERGDAIGNRVKKLFSNSPMTENDFIQQVYLPYTFNEEMGHAKDYAFAEWRAGRDLGRDPLRKIKTVEAILNHQFPPVRFSWSQALLSYSAQNLKAGTLMELSGQSYAVRETMDLYLKNNNPEKAYLVFLSYLNEKNAELASLSRYSVRDLGEFYYRLTGFHLIINLLLTKYFLGEKEQTFSNILRDWKDYSMQATVKEQLVDLIAGQRQQYPSMEHLLSHIEGNDPVEVYVKRARGLLDEIDRNYFVREKVTAKPARSETRSETNVSDTAKHSETRRFGERQVSPPFAVQGSAEPARAEVRSHAENPSDGIQALANLFEEIPDPEYKSRLGVHGPLLRRQFLSDLLQQLVNVVSEDIPAEKAAKQVMQRVINGFVSTLGDRVMIAPSLIQINKQILKGLLREVIQQRTRLDTNLFHRRIYSKLLLRLRENLFDPLYQTAIEARISQRRSEVRTVLPREFFDAVNGEYPSDPKLNSNLRNLGFVYYLALVYYKKLEPRQRLMGFIPGPRLSEKEVVEQTLIQMVEAHEELRDEAALPQKKEIIDYIWKYEKEKADKNLKKVAALLDERQWARDLTRDWILTRDGQKRYLADYIKQVISPRSETRSETNVSDTAKHSETRRFRERQVSPPFAVQSSQELARSEVRAFGDWVKEVEQAIENGTIEIAGPRAKYDPEAPIEVRPLPKGLKTLNEMRAYLKIANDNFLFLIQADAMEERNQTDDANDNYKQWGNAILTWLVINGLYEQFWKGKSGDAVISKGVEAIKPETWLDESNQIRIPHHEMTYVYWLVTHRILEETSGEVRRRIGVLVNGLPYERQAALTGLTLYTNNAGDSAAAILVLIQALRDENWEVREQVAAALGEIGFIGENKAGVLATVIHALIHALGDENSRVRQTVVVAVDMIQRRNVEAVVSAVPALIQLLGTEDADEDLSVRRAAVVTLSRIGRKSLEAQRLMREQAAAHENKKIRTELARILQDIESARSEVRKAATHIIETTLNVKVLEKQLKESAGVVVRVGVDSFVETLRSEVRWKMKELKVTQNEQPVQVTPEIAEMALNDFTNSLLKHAKGAVSFGIDREVNPSFVNAFRRVKSSVADLDRLWLQREMAKALDPNDLNGVNAQFVGRWSQYKPADDRPLPVAVGEDGASALDDYDLLFSIRGFGRTEGEPFFEELADAVDLIMAARLGSGDLIRKIEDLQDPAKRKEIRATLIREFFGGDATIVTDDENGFSINRTALFKRIVTQYATRAEIRKSA